MYLCIVCYAYTISKWNTIFYITFLLVFFAAASLDAVFGTAIVLLTSI